MRIRNPAFQRKTFFLFSYFWHLTTESSVVTDLDNNKYSFSTKKFVQNLAFSMLVSLMSTQKVVISFHFLTYVFRLCLIRIQIGSIIRKRSGSAVSVLQHCEGMIKSNFLNEFLSRKEWSHKSWGGGGGGKQARWALRLFERQHQ